MITAFELLSLALGGNLENNAYEVIPAKNKFGRVVPLEDRLSDLLEHDTNFEGLHTCVGSINHGGELGYLVKMVREIPTAHNLLGAAEAIYEVDTTEGENLYYVVWAITDK